MKNDGAGWKTKQKTIGEFGQELDGRAGARAMDWRSKITSIDDKA